MKRIVNTLFLVLLLTSCDFRSNNFDRELNQEKLVRLEFGKLGVSLKVPEGYITSEFEGFVTIGFHRGRQLSITTSEPDNPKSRYKESFHFENGVVLNYFTFVQEGGNGGPEYILEGVLKFDDKQFSVTSIDQVEYGKGKPEFCLKYLSTLKKLGNCQ